MENKHPTDHVYHLTEGEDVVIVQMISMLEDLGIPPEIDQTDYDSLYQKVFN